MVAIQDLWKLMNISNDRFIRTTDDYHELAVQRIFKSCMTKGTSTNPLIRANTAPPVNPSGPRASWWTANAPTAAGKSTTPKRPTFRLSKYSQRLVEYYEEHPDFMGPSPASTR